MKKIAIFIFAIVALIAAFATGWELSRQNNSPKSLPDAYLAYEHFYELTNSALENDSPFFDPSWRDKICWAQHEVDSVLNSEVLQWPEICNQRDQLSDVIRCIYDNDPDHQEDIEAVLKNFSGRTIDELKQWCFSY